MPKTVESKIKQIKKLHSDLRVDLHADTYSVYISHGAAPGATFLNKLTFNWMSLFYGFRQEYPKDFKSSDYQFSEAELLSLSIKKLTASLKER